MKACIAALVTLGSLLSLNQCGYHLGGLKARGLEGMKTYTVRTFENKTLSASASTLLVSALNDNLQRDGVFSLASSQSADFRIEGQVTSVTYESLRTNPQDTYLSTEIGMSITVRYYVVNQETGERILEATTAATGSYFNSTGNIQQARENALSYACRLAAENIVNRLTIR